MSLSKVFYTLINDKNTVFQRAEFNSDYVIFYARLRKREKKCSCCRSTNVRIKETKGRTFRMLNIGRKRTQLKIRTHKLWCQNCNKKTWISLPFTQNKLPMTTSFIHYIIQLTAMTTLLSVAIFLGLQWKTVKQIDKTSLARRSKQCKCSRGQ